MWHRSLGGPLISAKENNGSLLRQGPLLSVMHQVHTHTQTHVRTADMVAAHLCPDNRKKQQADNEDTL